MKNIEITLREILISIVIILVMIGLGFFIAGSIHDKVSSNNEKYFKALKVNNDPNLFDYAIRTQVGNLLSHGTFKANQPVSDKLIKGKYFAINKTEEHYTMHTRIVSYKCGKHTCHRTETYWTWDEFDSWKTHTESFNFLGRDFEYDKVDFNNYNYMDTIHTSYHVRFKFYVIPAEFKGTLYSLAKNKTIQDTDLYTKESIKTVINDKQHSADSWAGWFWVGWIILMLAIVICFIALENKFINNEVARKEC